MTPIPLRKNRFRVINQARRADVPVINDPVSLGDRVCMPSSSTRIVLAEQERATALRQLIAAAVGAAGDQKPPIEMAIGPEGGWTPDEESLFIANCWLSASLGPRILRAETAAVAALAVVASYVE